MQNKSIPVSQAVLYIVCQNIIDSLKTNLSEFSGFSASYTTAMVENLQKMLDDAKALPTESIRALEHEAIRLDLLEMLKPTLKYWKKLKRYIAKAYANNDAYITANWTAAGWGNYETAADKNWPSVIALMDAGSQYIDTNKAVLLANDNMPVTFQAAFELSRTAFTDKNNFYTTSKQHAQQGTSSKTTLNFDLYSAIIKVCLDGQLIFEDDILEKSFSFSAVTELVQPAGAAEAAVEVTHADTQEALSGVEVIMVGTDHEAVTDKNGDALLTKLSEGPAQLKFMCDGFADLFVDFDFNAGTRSRIKVKMEPLAVEVPAEAPVQPELVNA